MVERVPKTAPKGAVFCRLTSGTETYAVFLSSAVKKHVFKYFSEAGGFRVEDQGLSFPYGGNSERLQGLLGRRRPLGTASLQPPFNVYFDTWTSNVTELTDIVGLHRTNPTPPVF